MEKKSPSLEWFSSPFSHKLYASTTGEQTEAFVNQLVQHLHMAPGSLVLDSACGQGIASRRLASLGFQVTGVDFSAFNINQAKKTEQENPEFFLHDIRLPFWGNYFRLALNLSDSFGYYRTRRENDNAMRTIASSLRAGGLFVIDYPNTHYTESKLAAQDSKQLGDTHYSIQNAQTDTHFLQQITVTDPSLKEPQEFSLQRAKLSMGDFTDMLSFQGMQVQEVFGNYELAPYHLNETPRLIIIAKK